MAQRLYQAAVDRLPGLQELQGRLSTARDPKETMDLQARIGAEQAFIATQQQQAQAVMMWQAAEERSTEQRRREEMRRDLEATSDALLR
jgi:type IV secretion system protein VirB5